jgi:hypothetical protein
VLLIEREALDAAAGKAETSGFGKVSETKSVRPLLILPANSSFARRLLAVLVLHRP